MAEGAEGAIAIRVEGAIWSEGAIRAEGAEGAAIYIMLDG